MSFLEEQYLRRVSYKLRNYKEKGDHKFQFSCPICGDSETKKKRARGYAFDKSGSLIVHCHNCGYGRTLPNFLKEIDPLLYKEFIMTKFKEGINKKIIEPLADKFYSKITGTKKYVPNIFEGLPLVQTLEDSHAAKKYVMSRKLPVEDFEFYYAEKFIEWTKGHTDKFAEWKGPDHSRIVIPFKARDGRAIGYTARDISGSQEQKYYRIFIDATEKEKFFGINKVDESKTVYVLEGEIDSMFLPNAIAVSNGKLDTYKNPNAVYIVDIDIRNTHIMKNVKGMIEKGLNVCLLPINMPGKDINEIIVSGFTVDNLIKIINENTFNGLEAMLKFNNWKKV